MIIWRPNKLTENMYTLTMGTHNLHVWGYDPYIGGLKPSFSMVLGSRVSIICDLFAIVESEGLSDLQLSHQFWWPIESQTIPSIYGIFTYTFTMNILKNQLTVWVNIPYMNPIGYRSDLITDPWIPFSGTTFCPKNARFCLENSFLGRPPPVCFGLNIDDSESIRRKSSREKNRFETHGWTMVVVFFWIVECWMWNMILIYIYIISTQLHVFCMFTSNRWQLSWPLHACLIDDYRWCFSWPFSFPLSQQAWILQYFTSSCFHPCFFCSWTFSGPKFLSKEAFRRNHGS